MEEFICTALQEGPYLNTDGFGEGKMDIVSSVPEPPYICLSDVGESVIRAIWKMQLDVFETDFKPSKNEPTRQYSLTFRSKKLEILLEPSTYIAPSEDTKKPSTKDFPDGYIFYLRVSGAYPDVKDFVLNLVGNLSRDPLEGMDWNELEFVKGVTQEIATEAWEDFLRMVMEDYELPGRLKRDFKDPVAAGLMVCEIRKGLKELRWFLVASLLKRLNGMTKEKEDLVEPQLLEAEGKAIPIDEKPPSRYSPDGYLDEFPIDRKSDEADAERLVILGKNSANKMELEEAIDYFQNACKLDPDNKMGNFYLKRVEYQLKTIQSKVCETCQGGGECPKCQDGVCPSCKGSGWHDLSGKLCTFCGGEKECITCQGTGACPTCGGYTKKPGW